MGLESGSPSEVSDDEDDYDWRCPPSAARGGAWQERRAAWILAALLAAGALACGIALLDLEVWGRSRGSDRPSVAAAVDLGSERTTGGSCANWAELVVSPGVNTSDEVACALSCSSDQRCTHWNFMAPVVESNCSTPEWNCLLMHNRSRCKRTETACWNLYTRPSAPPASTRAVPVFLHGRSGVGCYRIPAIVRTAAGRLV